MLRFHALWMCGGKCDLAEKSLATYGGRQVRFENLERYKPVVLEIMGAAHCRHPAPADLMAEVITLAQDPV